MKQFILLLLIGILCMTGCAPAALPEPTPGLTPAPLTDFSPTPTAAPTFSAPPSPIPEALPPSPSPAATPILSEEEQRGARMWADLAQFTQTHRLAGTQGETDALGYAAGLFYTLGYTVQTQTVTRTEPSPVETFNVVGIKPANADNAPILILNAHADSVEMGPGATDNAAGLAVLLECARAAAALPAGKTEVRFIAFSAEEWQATGSTAYVAALPQEERDRITGVLTLDMFTSKNAPFIFGYYEDASVSRSFFSMVSAAAKDAGLLFGYDTPYQMMSDSTPFEAAGIPAVLVTQNKAEEEYHTENDRIECVDPERMEFGYQLAMSLIRRCAA